MSNFLTNYPHPKPKHGTWLGLDAALQTIGYKFGARGLEKDGDPAYNLRQPLPPNIGSFSAMSRPSSSSRPPLTILTANISFYVRVEPLSPNYQAQPIRHGDHGFWAPPNVRSGYTRGPSYTFRWMNGNMTLVGPTDPIGLSLHQPYSTATVFTQNPDTPHLLVVPFDAQGMNVNGYPGGWRPLVFRHIRLDNTRAYSAVSANGDRQHIAAPGLAHWMPQLLPPVYDYQMGSVRVQGGLIGSLPLLIALAAFSAPPGVLVGTLTNCVQPMAWRPHQFPYPAGHISERGMVVKIFFDPTNPQGSNAALLNRLQNGDFGPFYN